MSEVTYTAGEALSKGDQFGLNPADGKAYKFGRGEWPLGGLVPDDIPSGETFSPGGWLKYHLVDGITVSPAPADDVVIVCFYEGAVRIAGIGFTRQYLIDTCQTLLELLAQKIDEPESGAK